MPSPHFGIIKMLSKLAKHTAASDFYYLRSASAHETDKERERLHRIARQEDREFKRVICEFDDRVAKFAAASAGTNEKAETQLVYELELELPTAQLSTATTCLSQSEGAATENASNRKIKDVAAFVAKDTAVISAIARLDTVKDEFSAATAVTAARGFEVKLTKIRTVVTRIEPVEVPMVVKKAKKVSKVIEPVPLKSTKKANSALKLLEKPAEKSMVKAAAKAA